MKFLRTITSHASLKNCSFAFALSFTCLFVLFGNRNIHVHQELNHVREDIRNYNSSFFSRHAKLRNISEVGYVHFSCHRVRSQEYRDVGMLLRSKVPDKSQMGCFWETASGEVIHGKMELWRPLDHHDHDYEIVVFVCKLFQVPDIWLAGSLKLSISLFSFPVFHASPGSYLPLDIPQRRYFNLAYCGSPIFGHFSKELVHEWVKYHYYFHEIEHFHLYDAGGIGLDLLRLLEPFLQRGLVDVADSRDVVRYHVWAHAQLMHTHDCALRILRTSRWGLFTDFDEFLHVAKVPHNIKSYLTQARTSPWVSFGSIFYSLQHCEQQYSGEQNWLIERMVFRSPVPHCADDLLVERPWFEGIELCPHWQGHRKLIVDPSRVEVLNVHEVVVPSEGAFHAPTSELVNFHFSGLQQTNRTICSKHIHSTSEAVEGLVRDYLVASLVAKVKDHFPF